MDNDSSGVQEMEMSAENVRSLIENGESLTLVDVREPRERDRVHLQDDLWIRMGEIVNERSRIEEATEPVVFYCHHGVRSLKVARHFRSEGLEAVYSLAGGIDYWARNIDTDLPTY